MYKKEVEALMILDIPLAYNIKCYRLSFNQGIIKVFCICDYITIAALYA